MGKHNFTFSIDSAILNELGLKLVESKYIALMELVKNAYDADATTVEVDVKRDNNEKHEEIVIKDNGMGMCFNDVKSKWMRIATTNKATHLVSDKYGRPRTGAKGIGRFSCRRLGDTLKMETIGWDSKNRKYEKTTIDFKWAEFVAGKEVSAVKCYGTVEVLKGPSVVTGTTLLISNDKPEKWDSRNVGRMQRELVMLAAHRGTRREHYEEDLGFNLVMNIPGCGDKPENLREKLKAAGWGTITGKVDSNGVVAYSLRAKDIQPMAFKWGKPCESLRNMSFSIGILIANRDDMRDTSILAKRNLSALLDDWGGTQVYFNGFRVYPYGDDDWLEIDKHRGIRKQASQFNEFKLYSEAKHLSPRYLLNMLSHRSYMGEVVVQRDSGLEIKASREGFTNNKAFNELRDVVRYAIDWSVIHREIYLSSRRKAEADFAAKELEEIVVKNVSRKELVKSAAKFLQKEFDGLSKHIEGKEQTELKRKVHIAIKAILDHESQNLKEMEQLRLIAATSTLSFLLAHEVKSLAGGLEGSMSNLESLMDSVKPDQVSVLKETVADLDEYKERLIGLLNMTSLVGYSSKTSKLGDYNVREAVERVGKIFKNICDSYGVKIDSSRIEQTVRVGNILEAELYAILLNIFSNSIKSIIARDEDATVSIESSRTGNKTRIVVQDTGLGLNEANYEQVFKPFISDPEGCLYSKLDKNLNSEDKYIVGNGSGLGLSLIKEIIEGRGGSVRFMSPDRGWAAKLEILI